MNYCPKAVAHFEGGYQIDQPALTFESGTAELTLEDIPT